MNSGWSLLCVLVGVMLLAGSARAAPRQDGSTRPDRPQTHVETIASSRHEYTVTMGGLFDGVMTRDPIGYGAYRQYFEPNRWVRVENIGDVPVKNPWLLVNGKRDWRTVEKIVASVVRPGMTDKEKALALWWHEVNTRFHATTGDAENNDPVKVHNVYGYTLCGNDAINLFGLWSVAGLQVRACRIQGHCITEVFADGRWNLLDGDEQGLYLLRDNQTIASQVDLTRDHDLIKRTHTYGVLAPWSRKRDEFSASLFCYEEPGGKYHPLLKHRMEFTLRPGEMLEWRWGHDQFKFHGVADLKHGWGPTAASHVCLGRWRYHVDFTRPTWRFAGQASSTLVADRTGLHSAGESATLVIPMTSPYVFVGGKIKAEGPVALSLSWDGEKWQPLKLSGGTVDLDPLLPSTGPARYRYFLRLETGATPLRSVTIENDLQMAQLSLPELELGENRVVYTDETTESHKVRVTHHWVERSSTHPPRPVTKALFPPDGGTVRGTKLQFRWEPAHDPDGDEIADYEFLLSDRPDLAWPLSSNFHCLVSLTPDKGKAQFTLPYRGLLNSDTTYYWKVRPRDANHVWGPWSKVFTFQTKTPHPPVSLSAEIDQAAGRIVLHWQPAKSGTRPVAYKVYGSDEKGFSVSDVPYPVNVGNQGKKNTLTSPFPANFMCQTKQTACPVVGADLNNANANKAFYRVVAVAADGTESGPSDYLELPRPFVYTRPAAARVGREWRYEARTLTSLGDLRSRTINPRSLYNATYWDIEHPAWKLVAGPPWLTMDQESGVLSGTPQTAGEFPVSIAVRIGKKTASQHFTLRVR